MSCCARKNPSWSTTRRKKPADRMSQLPPKVRLPLLPLRDIVVFPHMMVPLYVGRSKSIRAVEEAMQGSREIVLAAQKKAKTNDPDEKDIFEYATVGQVMQHIKRPDGTIKVLVEGRRRTRIERFVETQQYFCVEVEDVIEIAEGTSEQRALQRQIIQTPSGRRAAGDTQH
jgi:ATP-dependent Lon protease